MYYLPLECLYYLIDPKKEKRISKGWLENSNESVGGGKGERVIKREYAPTFKVEILLFISKFNLFFSNSKFIPKFHVSLPSSKFRINTQCPRLSVLSFISLSRSLCLPHPPAEAENGPNLFLSPLSVSSVAHHLLFKSHHLELNHRLEDRICCCRFTQTLTSSGKNP